jgi:hypothetical protein
MQLTEQDRNNLIAFLDRVETRGIQEAQVLIALVQKISQHIEVAESE